MFYDIVEDVEDLYKKRAKIINFHCFNYQFGGVCIFTVAVKQLTLIYLEQDVAFLGVLSCTKLQVVPFDVHFHYIDKCVYLISVIA